ncbi:TonB family protein [Microvirga lotononidis]|uniref:Protein TonB n=1 Tax=Microvirga lotononidis TaxID=864069 RepID=I4YLI8_9HYPH|nr:TonB family protein [Microvirga lotononidis]EIM24830.1 TonB family protein [Microvirga lotononidis]WQO29667.1 TonB family protein [Microvirga lotononidis]
MRSPQEPSRLGIAFATALLLHGTVLTAVTFWPSDKAEAPGEQEITIDLAPAMEELVSVAPSLEQSQEVSPVETESPPMESETIAEQPPEEIIEAQPQDVTEAAPVEAVPLEQEIVPTEAVILPPPEAVVAKPLEEKPAPKPEKKPPPKPVERKPPPRRAVAEPRPRPSDERQGQASASRENMGGQAASADPTARNRYLTSLVASLRNRLRYPDVARSQGVTGIATVRFTMDRSGRIVGASLVRSAGHPALDQAALAAASPGSSLPPIPDFIPQSTFTVPLRFNLR